MAYDQFTDSSAITPARRCAVVTVSDNDQVTVCKSFRAGNAGTIRLTGADMADGTYVDHPVNAGEVVALMVKRFWLTGTTGGMGIIGYYD